MQKQSALRVQNFPWHHALVTGGAGFIGSHISEALLATGCDIKIVDDFSSGKPVNISAIEDNPRVKNLKGDICDGQFLKEALKDVEIVFHEAAIVSVQKSISEPEVTNRVNSLGTKNLLECSANSGVRKLMFASSAAVYGNSKVLPRSEDSETQPISPYGQSKLNGEIYCLDYHKNYGLATVVFRYFNVYGPRSTSKEYSGVINKFAERISQGLSPIIYGNGKNSRDFVYVDDIVQANLLAASSPNSSGRIYNVGTGIECSIEKLAKLECKIIRGNADDIPIEFTSPKQGDVRQSYADITRIKYELGFQPEYPIEKGLELYLKSLNLGIAA
jgi:UDP-glucose 4-epimerase